MNKNLKNVFFVLIIMMVVLIIAYNYENNAGATKDISYSDFLNMLEPVEGKNLSVNYIRETLTNTTKSKLKRT